MWSLIIYLYNTYLYIVSIHIFALLSGSESHRKQTLSDNEGDKNDDLWDRKLQLVCLLKSATHGRDHQQDTKGDGKLRTIVITATMQQSVIDYNQLTILGLQYYVFFHFSILL